jgi:hypothetical protein
MSRLLGRLRPLAVGVFALGFALSAQAAPEMFEASFLFHAWSNDVSSAAPATTPTWAISNYWTAAPLGYDCQHADKYTVNGAAASRYCEPAKMAKGHPATGMWSRSVGTGTPPRITLQQSYLGVQLNALPAGSVTSTPNCCRGFLITFPPYIQSFTYATFVNAAGSFFAGGGAAAGAGYKNYTYGQNRGTWRIRAGANAFGGAMGMLGKYGAKGKWSEAGQPTFYEGISSWAMVPDMGRPVYNTIIGETPMGKAYIYQNPFTKTAMWYAFTKNGGTNTSTLTAQGFGTLWTTGQVGELALGGEYATSIWRTGYDNRNASGIGRIQLVTPTITHWLSVGGGLDTHSAQVGLLTIQVPEPGAVLLLAAGGGILGLLYWVSRRV